MNGNILIKCFCCVLPLSLIFLICEMFIVILKMVAGLEVTVYVQPNV